MFELNCRWKSASGLSMARVHFGFVGEHGGLMAIYRRYRLGKWCRGAGRAFECRFRTQFHVKELPSTSPRFRLRRVGLVDLRFRSIVASARIRLTVFQVSIRLHSFGFDENSSVEFLVRLSKNIYGCSQSEPGKIWRKNILFLNTILSLFQDTSRSADNLVIWF